MDLITKTIRPVLLAALAFAPLPVFAQSFGQLLSGAGQVSMGMQQAENAAMQNRMLELQVQQANRDALLREMQYQQQMQQLRLMQEQQRIQAIKLQQERARLGIQ